MMPVIIAGCASALGTAAAAAATCLHYVLRAALFMTFGGASLACVDWRWRYHCMSVALYRRNDVV